MIETSDVDVSVWTHDSAPNPSPPETGTFSGSTQFLSRSPSGPTRLNVNDCYEFITRMKGERPITIKMEQESIYGGRGQWRLIKTFQLRQSELGFTLKIRLKDRHAGVLNLRYTASNSRPGAVIYEERLIVSQRCVGG